MTPGNRLEIEHRKPSSLTAYAGNARLHSAEQIEKLASAIQRFGFNQPIAVDQAGEIIAGHGRLLAAKKLGLETVPVIVLSHLSDEEKRAYVLVDNKISDLGEWDHDLLSAEVEALTASGRFNFIEFGFSDSELASLTRGLDELSITYEPNEPKPNHYDAHQGEDYEEREDYEGPQEESRRDSSLGEKMDPDAKLSKYLSSNVRYMQLNFPEERFEKLTKLMQGLCRRMGFESNAELVAGLVEAEAARFGGAEECES